MTISHLYVLRAAEVITAQPGFLSTSRWREDPGCCRTPALAAGRYYFHLADATAPAFYPICASFADWTPPLPGDIPPEWSFEYDNSAAGFQEWPCGDPWLPWEQFPPTVTMMKILDKRCPVTARTGLLELVHVVPEEEHQWVRLCAAAQRFRQVGCPAADPTPPVDPTRHHRKCGSSHVGQQVLAIHRQPTQHDAPRPHRRATVPSRAPLARADAGLARRRLLHTPVQPERRGGIPPAGSAFAKADPSPAALLPVRLEHLRALCSAAAPARALCLQASHRDGPGSVAQARPDHISCWER